MRAFVGPTVLGIAAAVACSSSTDSVDKRNAPITVKPATSPNSDAAPKRLRCGAAVCGALEFCEERFKGHAADEQGRPLQRKKCMPLPAKCRTTPTCACVTQHVSATHCVDKPGGVHLDDYPR